MANRFASPELQVKEITDPYIRNNFEKLVAYFAKQNQLLNFQFLDVEFTAAETERRVLHGLGLVPHDLLRLEISGSGKVTIHRDMFTKDFIFLSASGPVRVRFLAGLYWQAPAGNPSLSNEEWQAKILSEVAEAPSGEIDGVNTLFELSFVPTNLKLYYDGKFQRLGTHYTLEGKTITMITAPAADKLLDAVYNH